MKLSYSYRTHNASAIDPTASKGRAQFVPASRSNKNSTDDEIVMDVMERYMAGESIIDLAAGVGKNYQTVRMWCIGETKHSVYAKLMKKIEASKK